jgi:hypothetical protein
VIRAEVADTDRRRIFTHHASLVTSRFRGYTAGPMDPSTSQQAPTPPEHVSNPWSRWIVLGVAVLMYVVFSWVGGRVGIAKVNGFNGSLLASPGPFMNWIATAVLVAGGVAVGTILAGGVRPDAGLFAAAIGLLALSNRGRPVYAILHDTGGNRGAYLLMVLELVLLYVLLGVCWFVLYSMRTSGRLRHDAHHDGLADVELPAGAGWTATITHVAIMAIVVLLLAQSEDKKQVILAIGIGSFAGAFFPYSQHGARPSVWYWAAPLGLGVFGYLAAWFSPPTGIEVGRPGLAGGFLAALARPLPLDYASVGTAGALLGYWMRRSSLRDRQAIDAAAVEAARPAA